MADEKALSIRRNLLEELYRLYSDSPTKVGVWHADRSDPDRLPRMREAEYLRDKGYINGTIGADGGLALRLTAEKGRDYVEAGGFWAAASATTPALDGPSPSRSVHIVINGSTVHGDVIAGDKKTK